MKKLILIGAGALFFLACGSNTPAPEVKTAEPVEPETTEPLAYDSIKAYEYGADDYGMKQYVMAFLKKGPNRDRDSAESYNLQRAHLDNITRLADEGKLVLAGPFLNDGEIRGIYVFDVKTVEEAKALTETDPAIQAGSLEMELIPWYGSAGLKGVYELHHQIAKLEI
ncbi:MAG: hypothetical protein KDD41_04655 [Flavobacteriales bacterium]|nr:hypothetical protein [Flavobacteriales bacterium]